MYGQGMYPGGTGQGAYAYVSTPGQQGQAGPSRPGREAPQSTYTEGKVFIGGLDPSITSEDVAEHCSQWGEVVDAVSIKDRGYGFATFKDPASAQSFLEAPQHVIKGIRLDVKAAMPKVMGGASKRTNKLFVGGTGDLTDEDLREHFSQFGEIQDAAVVRREGKSRGFGFVTFAEEMSVEKCLVQYHIIHGKKVEPKRAVPREAMSMPGAGAPGFPMRPPPPGVPGMGPPLPGPYPQQMAGGYSGYMGVRPPGMVDPYMMMQMGYPAMWGYPAYQYAAPGMQVAAMGWPPGSEFPPRGPPGAPGSSERAAGRPRGAPGGGGVQSPEAAAAAGAAGRGQAGPGRGGPPRPTAPSYTPSTSTTPPPSSTSGAGPSTTSASEASSSPAAATSVAPPSAAAAAPPAGRAVAAVVQQLAGTSISAGRAPAGTPGLVSGPPASPGTSTKAAPGLVSGQPVPLSTRPKGAPGLVRPAAGAAAAPSKPPVALQPRFGGNEQDIRPQVPDQLLK